MMENSEVKPMQVIEGKKIAGSIPPFAKKPVRTVNDAKRMLSKLIHGFQLGTINGTDAKTLCYLLISYTQIIRDFDFEERIKKLEERAKNGA